MKAESVIFQLQTLLPQLVDQFTTNSDVLSVVRSATILTVKTKTPHEFAVDDIVALTGAVSQIVISSITRVATVATLVTATDHDLTDKIALTITISGATESEFNGTFTRLEITNRRTITFTVADSGATSVTGSPVLEGAESPLRDYNISYRVESTPDVRTFTVNHAATTLLNPIGTIKARGKPRVSGAASAERALDAYTSKATDEWWAFVVLGDVGASKDPRITAANVVADANRGNHLRQILSQPFSVLVFVSTKEEIAGRLARDNMEVLFPSICKCLLWSKLDTQLAKSTQNTVQFSDHGFLGYDSAVYMHRFIFAQVAELGERDAVGPDIDVAFRDLALSMVPDLGTQDVPMTATIDLDKTALP